MYTNGQQAVCPPIPPLSREEQADVDRLAASVANAMPGALLAVRIAEALDLTPAELLEVLQTAAARLPVPNSVVEALITLRRELGSKGVTASDRRWRQSLGLLKANALLEGRKTVEEDDLGILSHSLWTTPDQRQEIARTVARMANPLNAKALELLDQAASVHEQAMKAQAGDGDDEQKMQAAVEGNTKLKKITTHLKKLAEQAEGEGRSGTKIAQAQQRIAAMRWRPRPGRTPSRSTPSARRWERPSVGPHERQGARSRPPWTPSATLSQ